MEMADEPLTTRAAPSAPGVRKQSYPENHLGLLSMTKIKSSDSIKG